MILGNGGNPSPLRVNRLNTANNGGEDLQSITEEDNFTIGNGPVDVTEADLSHRRRSQ